MDINQIIAVEMTPRDIEFWGQSYNNFTPKLSRTIHGDGGRLMYLTPLYTRPLYYIIRVDSKYPSNEDDEDEFLDDVVESMFEEFGDELNLSAGFNWGFYSKDGEV